MYGIHISWSLLHLVSHLCGKQAIYSDCLRALTIVGHGEDGDLGDGTVPALHTAGTLVDGGQIGVHVSREATASRDLFSGSGHLQGQGSRQKVCSFWRIWINKSQKIVVVSENFDK